MARKKKKVTQPKPKPGRKPKVKRMAYTWEVKQQARDWHFNEHMGPTAVKIKLLETMNINAPESTICTWWNAENMAIVNAIAPDRLHVRDTRRNPKQRPDILVDTERVLSRKVIANMNTGLPYTNAVIQILAVKIFHKLISLNLYTQAGQRRSPTIEVSEEIIQAVQYPMCHSRYLARSNGHTEYHKSKKARRNVNLGTVSPKKCQLCPRIFKSSVNLTLHVFWHTYRTENVTAMNNEDDADPDDPNEEDVEDRSDEEEDTGIDYKFVASPGWIQRFVERYDLQNYRMKGEKGSANYAAIEPWVSVWLRELYEDCQLHDKSLTWLMTIIVNFDECGIQYKSLPQRSYVGRHHEIRAKKPNKARITGLFGATASGFKFKPVIIGQAAMPRAFRGLDLANLPVHYYHSSNAWMTGDIFREWFLNCFMIEVDAFRNDHIRIQFVLDNCSAHPIDLEFMDPDITFKFLPPNTTSVIQPMDQAVLCSTKARAKRAFHQEMFNYCELHPDEPEAINAFVRQYTILDAIRHIAAAWYSVPESTIVKSFHKIFPKEEWDKLSGDNNDFEGFLPHDFEQRPVPDNVNTHLGDVGGQVINQDFQTEIAESLQLLNLCHSGVQFTKEDIIQDVLLNPGQTDENVDNIIDEVLHCEDLSWYEEDMVEHVEPEAQAVGHLDPRRFKVYKVLGKLSNLRGVDITENMAVHKKSQWKGFVKGLEDLAMECLPSKSDSASYKQAHVPATHSIDAIPSTSSGVTNHSDIQISAKGTRSTLINAPTQVHSSTRLTNHSDVPSDTSDDEENVINTKEYKINTGEDYMEVAQELGIYESPIYDQILGQDAPIYENNIVHAEIISKEDFDDESDICVTTFRPLNEKEMNCRKSKVKSQKDKFERHEDEIEGSTFDDTLDETDLLHCPDENTNM